MNEQQKEALRAMNIDQLKYLICVEMGRIDPDYLPESCEWIVEELIEKAANL